MIAGKNGTEMTAPRVVSVVIATHNRPQQFRQALASIRALEGPDIKFEILVGDNGTLEENQHIAEEFGAIFTRTTRNFCPGARNAAMEKVSGEFVAFLDDDDVWMPGHIRPHIAFLDANPDYAGVFGQVVSTDQDLNPIDAPWPQSLPEDGDCFHMLMSGYFPQVGATLMRADVVRKYGLMDETLFGDSDWDWTIRIAAENKFGFTPTQCVLFRQRPRGTFDKMQLRRSAFTRRIFLRHARKNPGRWSNLREMIRSYYGTQMYYWFYFIDAARLRAEQGQKWGVVKAFSSALWIYPTRTLRSFIKDADTRSIIRTAVSRKSQPLIGE